MSTKVKIPVRRARVTLKNANIAKPSLVRVARRAGVVSLQELMYPEMRRIINMQIDNIIKFAYIFAKYRDRKTITFDDVKLALERLGLKVWGVNRIEKVNRSGLKTTSPKRKIQRGTKAVREVKKYQQSSSLLIARAPIERLIRKSMGSWSRNFRIEARAISLIHVVVEKQMTQLLAKSQLAAIHAKRKTVQTKNVSLIRKLNNAVANWEV